LLERAAQLAGDGAAIRKRYDELAHGDTWMAGSSPAMTK